MKRQPRLPQELDGIKTRIEELLVFAYDTGCRKGRKEIPEFKMPPLKDTGPSDYEMQLVADEAYARGFKDGQRESPSD